MENALVDEHGCYHISLLLFIVLLWPVASVTRLGMHCTGSLATPLIISRFPQAKRFFVDLAAIIQLKISLELLISHSNLIW